jgi:hypothetical protein
MLKHHNIASAITHSHMCESSIFILSYGTWTIMRDYHLVWFCGGAATGNWKKGNAPLPRAYGICPFHLLIDSH